MSLWESIFGTGSAVPTPDPKFASANNPRGGKFEVFNGPLHGQFLDYTGERFRADAAGPFAEAFPTHEYRLRTDEYSDRLYYIWTPRDKKP